MRNATLRLATLNGHNCRAAIPRVSLSLGISTMSEFDWRSSETYKPLQAADAPDFAWECLRRNNDYRTEYRALQNDGSPDAVSSGFRSRWGLSFRS